MGKKRLYHGSVRVRCGMSRHDHGVGTYDGGECEVVPFNGAVVAVPVILAAT